MAPPRRRPLSIPAATAVDASDPMLAAAGGVEAPARPRTTGRIGESVPRPDGIPRNHRIVPISSDLWADGMLWGRALRSPHRYARIRSINIAPALAWSCEPPLIGGGPRPLTAGPSVRRCRRPHRLTRRLIPAAAHASQPSQDRRGYGTIVYMTSESLRASGTGSRSSSNG